MSELVEFEIAQQADISRASVCAQRTMRRIPRIPRLTRRYSTTTARHDVAAITTEVSIDDLDGMRLHLLSSNDIPDSVTEPWWALLWPGGHALASHILRHPSAFRGRVVDVGSGSGVVGIAAALAGASSVVVNDLSLHAAAAATLNAEANGVRVLPLTADILGSEPADHFSPGDCVVVGDVLYDPDVARRMLPWLQRLAAFGVVATVGDPGRPVSAEYFESMELLEEVELPAVMPSEVFWEHFGAVRASVWRVAEPP